MLTVKLPTKQSASDNGFDVMFRLHNESGLDANRDAPIQIYNNTFIDLRAEGDLETVQATDFSVLSNTGNGNFTDATVANNVNHQPYVTTHSVTADAPIDLDTLMNGIIPRHQGTRRGFNHEEGTFASQVSGSGGTFTLSYADVKDTVHNYTVDDGSATTQGYWTALSEGNHHLEVDLAAAGEGGHYMAEAPSPEFTVSFGASEITVTNNTGYDFEIGDTWILRFDRNSLHEAWRLEQTSVGTSVLYFDAGTSVLVEGLLVTGGSSGHAGTIERISVESGTWGGNNAAGYVVLSGATGVFQDNETITDAGTGSATTDGTALANVPTGQPTVGSAAIGDGDVGLKAYDDLLLNVRPAIGNDRGALLS